MVFLNPVKIFVFSLLFCTLIFILHFLYVGSGVWGDGRYYYSSAHSLAIDQDFNFENQYQKFYINEPISDTGLPVNKYAPGTSLIYLPILFIIGVFDCATTSLNCSQIGYSAIYQISTGIVSILLVFGGLYFLYITLQKYFNQSVSLLATLSTLFATNLLFYAAFDPINSHPISFFFASIFTYILITFKNSYFKWTVLGIVLGWLTLTRTMDFIFVIPLVYFLIRENKKLGMRLIMFTITGLMMLMVFSIQLLFWHTIYGSLQSPYLTGNEGFNLFSPHLFEVLINNKTGLIIWTPFVFLGFMALFKIKNSYKRVFILTILIAYYLIASWSSWDQGGSFGNRMLISYLPFISFGFAYIFEKKKWKKFIMASPISIIIASAVINLSFIITYLYLY